MHLVRGTISVNGQRLNAGDAALLAQEDSLVLDHAEGAEVLVFDLTP